MKTVSFSGGSLAYIIKKVNSLNFLNMYSGNRGRLENPLKSQIKQPINISAPITISVMTVADFQT